MTAIETFPPFGPTIPGERRPKLPSITTKRTGHIYRDCEAVDLVAKKGRKVSACEICLADSARIAKLAREAQEAFDRAWMAEHSVAAAVLVAAATVEPSPIPAERSIPSEAAATEPQVRKLMALYRKAMPNATHGQILAAEKRAAAMTKATASATIAKLERNGR